VGKRRPVPRQLPPDDRGAPVMDPGQAWLDASCPGAAPIVRAPGAQDSTLKRRRSHSFKLSIASGTPSVHPVDRRSSAAARSSPDKGGSGLVAMVVSPVVGGGFAPALGRLPHVPAIFCLAERGGEQAPPLHQM